jgi:hypothetical protein
VEAPPVPDSSSTGFSFSPMLEESQNFRKLKMNRLFNRLTILTATDIVPPSIDDEDGVDHGHEVRAAHFVCQHHRVSQGTKSC